MSNQDKVQFACPKCGWRPTAEDRWASVPSSLFRDGRIVHDRSIADGARP